MIIEEVNMSVKEEVKMLLAKEGMTMTRLAQEITVKTGQKWTMKTISDKLARKTMKYEEFRLILEILGYSIKYEKFK